MLPEGSMGSQIQDAAIALLRDGYGIFPITHSRVGARFDCVISTEDLEMLKGLGLGATRAHRLGEVTGLELNPSVRGNEAADVFDRKIREILYHHGSGVWQQRWFLEDKGCQRVLAISMPEVASRLGSCDLGKVRDRVQAVLRDDVGIDDVAVRMRDHKLLIAIPYKIFGRLEKVMEPKSAGMLGDNIVDLASWAERQKERNPGIPQRGR